MIESFTPGHEQPSEIERHRPAFAILCDALVKRYRVFRQGVAWRILLSARDEKVVEAIRGVSLSVEKGEILGVLGRNGSGKSTLLRVVGGIYSPNSGSVRVSGQVGSLFELGGLGNQFITGRQYADRVLRFQGVSGRSLPKLLAEIQDFSEIGDYFDRRLHTYSTGMAARLYFATATALPREVFLIDEILSVGDAHFQAKSWRRVRDRLADGASGILVTHDWSAVIKLCRRALILDRGVVVAEGPADRVVAQYLQIPTPDGSIAGFGELPPTFRAISGEDLTLDFPVHAHRDVAIEFACSIELLRLGVGWEILILSEFSSAGSGRGKRTITLTIPRLPLAPGEYSLNVFLRTPITDGGIPVDARTWTSGTGLTLTVGGASSPAVTRLPAWWRIRPTAPQSHV